MRIAIGGFIHETNTFNPARTTLAGIKSDGIYLEGDAVLDYYRGTKTTIGGFVVGCERTGLTMVPNFFAYAGATTGLIDRDVVEHITEKIVAGVRAARPDGVLLHLHGAAAADGVTDPEAYILAAVRSEIGRLIPLMVVYDLHANIGSSWVDSADAIIGYKTAPHCDNLERGVDGAVLMHRTLAGEVRPVVRMRKPAVLVKSGLMTMTDAPLALIKPPMYWLMNRAHEMERMAGVLNISIAAGFGDADVPEAGMTMLATTDGDPALAQKLVDELSEMAWQLRRGFLTDLVLAPVDTAVRRAVNSPVWPVILSDQGNNTAGGSPGDGTAILGALKENGWPDASLFIRDAAAAKEAVRVGIGGRFIGSVGGKLEPTNGDPVQIEGSVRAITDGEFYEPHFGVMAHLGVTAVVRCGLTDVILATNPCSQYSPAFFRSVGIEPRERRITIVQSAHLFRDEFEVKERIPKVIIDVDSPGICNPNTMRFNYHYLSRPIFPLDDVSVQPGTERKLV